ncbi:integrase domain-containing protein [Chitinibacter sp. SCUT-21]|uniref:tyrosine-type recombinase/integrase n=1 Tax=Chitinibacter sp. SCUT-21 TaxID=2970891 RepID=UPI0035A610A5
MTVAREIDRNVEICGRPVLKTCYCDERQRRKNEKLCPEKKMKKVAPADEAQQTQTSVLCRALEQHVRQGDILRQLGVVFKVFLGGAAKRDKVISHKTKEIREQTIVQAYRQLKQDGFAIKDIRNIKPKHINHLIGVWQKNNLSVATMHSRLSILRVFCEWLGKSGMIPPAAKLLPEHQAKRSYVAEKDKSWTAHEIDPEQLIRQIQQFDLYVAMQLEVIQAFGLRRKEAICFKPWQVETPEGDAIRIYSGTKGGRPRMIPIDTPQKRAVIEAAKAFVPHKQAHIADPDKTLKQNIARFGYVMLRFGITKEASGATAHGLRHQYANDRFEEFTGNTTPVRGGDGRVDEAINEARYRVSEELGHSRIKITNSYYGKFQRQG